jgi:AraC-like DNA-binding protein
MIEIFDNIRKIYQFHPPCEELATYIEFFSESSPDATGYYIGNNIFTVKMFPSWTPTFWFNLGSSYFLNTTQNSYSISPGKDVLLIRDCIVERYNLPTDHIFSIKFFPGGLEAIFGIDQSRMKNQVIDLRQILPAELIMRIKTYQRFEDRMHLLQDYFLSQLIKRKKRDHYLKFINDTITCYETAGMQYNVNELSARLFTTSKTINRYFNQVIGISPKNYFSILRARTALTAFVGDKKTFLPTDFGYYDMSHFHKEIFNFTGKKLTLHTH